MENKRILIYAERGGEKIEASCHELLSKARELFPSPEVEIALCIVGKGIGSVVNDMVTSGADIVFGLDSQKLEIYHVDYYAAALEQIAKAFKPDVFLIPASSTGEELAPTLGLKLKTGVAAHCVDLKVDENGAFLQLVPAFGGRVMGEIFTPKTRPQIASIKPGMFSITAQEPRKCRIEMVDGSDVDKMNSKITVKRVERQEFEGVPVERAQVIVCGGFGIDSLENWKNIEKLAGLLGGAAGCTRPAVDQGWVSGEQQMIGTSGKTVRPKVYIGAGISGATHHVCGMKDSNVIISINRDEDAEIFGVSDYKIVADGVAVIEALCERITSKSFPESTVTEITS